MASEHSSLESVLHEMTPAIISSGLIPNPPPSTSFVPPTRTDWDLLFQLLFDELLTPPPNVDLLALVVIALITEVVALKPPASTSSPSSKTVNQEAPSPRLQISQSPKAIFLNQYKYALESLKKYGMKSSDPVDTPIVEKSKLDEDLQRKAIDPTYYRTMVGTLIEIIEFLIKKLGMRRFTPETPKQLADEAEDSGDSKAYKEYYAVASGAEHLKAKTKYKKKADEPVTSFKSKTAPASKAEQIKLATKRSKKDFHMSHTSGSGDGVNIQSKVPDEQQQKVTSINERVGVRLEVLDVPKYALESDEKSWTFSQDEDDVDEETDVNNDSEEIKYDNDGDDLTHPNLLTYKADDKEKEEKADDNEVSSDQRMYTPPDYQLTDEE
nr:uncharacterized mitochondrial protein AtMg00810-like [Tanacetum cinerariifolium]GEX81031.1 uncharacterized mitochondrial protein AtMg00810-like [Tanacetum cinerariifolium]